MIYTQLLTTNAAQTKIVTAYGDASIKKLDERDAIDTLKQNAGEFFNSAPNGIGIVGYALYKTVGAEVKLLDWYILREYIKLEQLFADG